jgi:hypothetical protein
MFNDDDVDQYDDRRVNAVYPDCINEYVHEMVEKLFQKVFLL